MRRNKIRGNIRFSIFGILLIVISLFGSNFSLISADNDWLVSVSHGQFLDLNPFTTKWLVIKEHLSAITLIDGKIAVFEQSADRTGWIEVQRIGPADVVITTFQVKDINGDGVGEIIAGTVEPGFVYLYKLTDGKWELFNYGKYVWSAISNIIVGNFGQESGNDILVQNQEGYLYLLKITDNSLDLIWKSPAAWRPIISGYVKDIDNDLKDEILVVYKTGGIGVLKVDNNSIVSVWENYLWGKVLGVAAGDWDNDHQPEFMISTSQKIVYFLGWDQEKQVFHFEKQWSQFNCILEEMAFLNNNDISQLLATDTAGKLHLYQYDPKNTVWNEYYVCQTGRIAQIIDIKPEHILLWGLNRKLVTVETLLAKNIKLKYRGQLQEISPSFSYNNDYLYLAPKALQTISDLNLGVKDDKTSFTITTDSQMIKISKKNLDVKVNGNLIVIPHPPIIINQDLYLTLDSYQELLDISLEFDPVAKVVVLKDSSIINPEATPSLEDIEEDEAANTDSLPTDNDTTMDNQTDQVYEDL